MAGFKTLCAQGVRPLVLPDEATVEYATIDINWPDAGATVASSDVIQICDIPPNVEIVDWKFMTDDIDTGATAAFTLGYLNSGKTAMGAGTYDTFTSVGGISGQVAGTTVPSGTTAPNCVLAGRGTLRTLGLLATGASAGTLVGKKAVVMLGLRTGMY